MGLSDIIFLVLAILSGSFAIALLIAGIMVFQNFDLSKKQKFSSAELVDGIFFNSLFKIMYRIFQNWDKNKEGRQYLYGSILFTVIAIGLLYFITFK